MTGGPGRHPWLDGADAAEVLGCTSAELERWRRMVLPTGPRRRSGQGDDDHRPDEIIVVADTVSAFELGDLTLDHVSLLCRANLFALAVEFARDEATLVDKARTLSYDEFARERRNWAQVVDYGGGAFRAQVIQTVTVE